MSLTYPHWSRSNAPQPLSLKGTMLRWLESLIGFEMMEGHASASLVVYGNPREPRSLSLSTMMIDCVSMIYSLCALTRTSMGHHAISRIPASRYHASTTWRLLMRGLSFANGLMTMLTRTTKSAYSPPRCVARDKLRCHAYNDSVKPVQQLELHLRHTQLAVTTIIVHHDSQKPI